MKYRVTGSNRDTGARMSLEFDADSKGAAERKAAQAGMNVSHVEIIPGEDSVSTETSARGLKRSTGIHPLIKLLILVLIIVAAYVYLWPKFRGVGD